MRKTTKLFVLPLMAMMLTSCDILGAIRSVTGLQPQYENYEEFFAEAMHFKSGVTFDVVMNNINKELRYWTRHNSQYSSTNYAIVEAPFFETINEYSDYFTVYLTNCDYISINKTASNDGSILALYTTNRSICVDGENHKWLNGDTQKREDFLNEDEKAMINVYADDNGYLVISNSHSIFYISKDLQKIYFNDSNTRTFRYMTAKDEYDKVTVPESAVLTAAIEEAKNSRTTLALPKPTNDSLLKGKYWYGYGWRNIDVFGRVDEKQQEYITTYNLYFPGIEAYTYAQQLEQQGWTIHRANDEDLISTTSQKYDSYWLAVDEAEQYKIKIDDQSSLYADLNALFTDGPAHSTRLQIDRLGGIEKKVAGKQTTKTDWTDREKRTMRKWYDLDVELPFVALSDSYSVPLTNSSAYSGLYSNLVELGTKCYNIEDHYYKYLLDGYGEVLEANGFSKFEMPASVNPDDYSTVYEWYKVENHKLYNSYVNYDKDVAVRFYFDVSLGNIIRFFRISTMTAWDPARDPDTTDYDALEDPYITVNPDE